jgi:hypothetical protein
VQLWLATNEERTEENPPSPPSLRSYSTPTTSCGSFAIVIKRHQDATTHIQATTGATHGAPLLHTQAGAHVFTQHHQLRADASRLTTDPISALSHARQRRVHSRRAKETRGPGGERVAVLVPAAVEQLSISSMCAKKHWASDTECVCARGVGRSSCDNVVGGRGWGMSCVLGLTNERSVPCQADWTMPRPPSRRGAQRARSSRPSCGVSE